MRSRPNSYFLSVYARPRKEDSCLMLRGTLSRAGMVLCNLTAYPPFILKPFRFRSSYTDLFDAVCKRLSIMFFVCSFSVLFAVFLLRWHIVRFVFRTGRRVFSKACGDKCSQQMWRLANFKKPVGLDAPSSNTKLTSPTHSRTPWRSTVTHPPPPPPPPPPPSLKPY